MKDDSRSHRKFVLVSSFILLLEKATGKEDTSKRETKADVCHKLTRCFIKLLMTVVREQIAQILIAVIVCFVPRNKIETDFCTLCSFYNLIIKTSFMCLVLVNDRTW